MPPVHLHPQARELGAAGQLVAVPDRSQAVGLHRRLIDRGFVAAELDRRAEGQAHRPLPFQQPVGEVDRVEAVRHAASVARAARRAVSAGDCISRTERDST